MSEPADVLARLAAELSEVFDDDLWSLAVHGSWALGDFAPGRSDLDLLAVMATDPTPATLAGLDDVHARLDRDFPEWNGHLEVDYVSAEAVEAVVRADESHPMIRISPGEPLHEVEASRHYVLNWAAALQADRPIAGAAPSTVLPAIDRRLIHQVVLPTRRGVAGMGARHAGDRRAGLRRHPLPRCGNAGDWSAGVEAGGRQCGQITVPGVV